MPLLFLPLRFLEARKTGRRSTTAARWRAAVVIVAIATWRYGLSWLGAAGPLARNLAEDRAWYAIPSRIASLGLPEGAVALVFALAFVVAYAWLLREAWRGRARLALTACILLDLHLVARALVRGLGGSAGRGRGGPDRAHPRARALVRTSLRDAVPI